jgi:hypothetical protein
MNKWSPDFSYFLARGGELQNFLFSIVFPICSPYMSIVKFSVKHPNKLILINLILIIEEGNVTIFEYI